GLPVASVSVVHVGGNAHGTYRNRVTFDVTVTPGLIPGTGNVAVAYRVTYKSTPSSAPQPGGDGTVYVPAAGGTTRVSVSFPRPADANFIPDFINEITVQIDPDNTIAESDKANNT